MRYRSVRIHELLAPFDKPLKCVEIRKDDCTLSDALQSQVDLIAI